MNIFVPLIFILIPMLMISKIPTYSFKKIVIQRKFTIFLLFGIVLLFGLLLIFPFNTLLVCSTIYLFSIPFSVFHYLKTKKNKLQNLKTSTDEPEDVL